MGDIISYFNVVKGISESQTVSNIVSFEEVANALNGYGASAMGGAYGKVVSGMSAAEAESAIAASASAPVKIAMSETAAGTGAYNMTMTTGKVVEFTGAATSSDVSAAAVLQPHAVIIMAVAAAMGYCIGWDIAQQIDEWLGNRDFDWGRDSIAGKTVTYVTKGVDGQSYYQYVWEDLVQRLGQALGLWGINDLPNNPPSPTNPNPDTATSYDFENRFPPVPARYRQRCQDLIDKYNINIENCYISVGVAPDDNTTLTVFNTNNFTLLYRDARTNANTVMPRGTTRLRVKKGTGTLTFSQWESHADGTTAVNVNNQEIFIGSWDFMVASPGCVWDNFGSSYVKSDNGKLTSATNDVLNIKTDPHKVPLEFPANIPVEFPDWWNHRILVPHPDLQPYPATPLDPSKVTNPQPYLPLPIQPINPNPTEYPQGQPDPVTDPIPQYYIIEDPQPVPYPRYDPIDWPVSDPETGQDDKPTDTDTPTDTPTIPTIPTSSGVSDSGMVALYNPTKAQLRAFSAWLWSMTDDMIKKLFQDPMQAIIGLHMIYASPDTLGSSTIVVGKIDSEKPSNYIGQYTTINCGTIKINPYFKTVHDYISTSIQIYLPFIGIINLDTADVMDKSMQVIYKIDWLSGACLAYINLKKGNGSFYTAYTFSGNCSVEFPITGASYSSITSSVIVAAGSIAASLVTKNPHVAGTAITATTGAIAGSNVNITRSGNISGNAGAMGIKKPYLIINRNIPIDASNRGHYEGMPQRLTATLKSQSGFTRVFKVNLDGLACTEIEKDRILEQLKEGVFI